MGYIQINGDFDIARISLDNTTLPSNNEDGTNTYLNHIKDIGIGDNTWNDNSVVLANMNNSLSGNGDDYQFAGISHFRIYKTIGNDNTKMYLVYETQGADERIIKDYVVGDYCDYKYYIYPICNDMINEVSVEIISQPFSSNEINLAAHKMSVMGLVPVEGRDNWYTIDKNNIWLLSLNLKDGGTVLNTSKVFSDTLNRYQQLTGDNRAYKTKNVSSLLGEINCTTLQYVDSFEKIEAWDEFCRMSNLKVLVDLRGRILIGDIDNSSSIEYGNNFNKEATVSFVFRELTDINNVIILGEAIDSGN